MTQKQLISGLTIIVSSLFLAACTTGSEVVPSTPSSVTTPVEQPATTGGQPTSTDEELLQQMESDTEIDLDREFLQLEKDIQ